MSTTPKTHLVFIDTETAGLERDAELIQIAAIAVDSCLNELDVFETKLTFHVERASPEALKLNSFDARTWDAEAVPPLDAAKAFAGWLHPHRSRTLKSKRTGRPWKAARIAGHNIGTFDVPRLLDWSRALDVFLPFDLSSQLDTRFAAVWWFDRSGKELPEGFSLDALGEVFDLGNHSAHDALGDVRRAIALARSMGLGAWTTP